MRITESELRGMVRQALEERFRHAAEPHKHTTSSKKVVRSMQTSSQLQNAFDSVKRPQDLAAVLEELIDSVGLSRDEIRRALNLVMQHEKPRGGALK